MSSSEYKFEEEWPLGTGIGWWDEGREKLNKVIRYYNRWQRKDFPMKEKRRVLATIEEGIQTFAQRDGGSGWLEVLERMKAFVEGKHKEKANETST